MALPRLRDNCSTIFPQHGDYQVVRWGQGTAVSSYDCLAEEIPVGLAYNGITHGIMLATPNDIEDSATGVSQSEDIVECAEEIYDFEVTAHGNGIEVKVEIASARTVGLRTRRRALAGRTGCGLCGSERLDRFLTKTWVVHSSSELTANALSRAQAKLVDMQHLFQLIGAVHAAAWCNFAEEIELVREDVGRHNALDKLIGTQVRRRQFFAGGFVLLTSRASYEMVRKAASVGIAFVAAVSAPAGMSVRMAEEAGVALICFTRSGRHSIYAHPERVH